MIVFLNGTFLPEADAFVPLNDRGFLLGDGLFETLRVAGAYVYDHAKVTEFAANPALANNCPGRPGESCLLPQVPAHRGSMHVSYSNMKYATVALGVQFLGRQFDDDQNVRAVPLAALNEAGYSTNAGPGLPGYAVVDLTASRTVVRNLDAFFGVQNVFDQEYFVGTLPTTIGSPRLVSGGIRVRFAGR